MKSSESGVPFALLAHLTLDQPHFKGSKGQSNTWVIVTPELIMVTSFVGQRPQAEPGPHSSLWGEMGMEGPWNHTQSLFSGLTVQSGRQMRNKGSGMRDRG